eukprot:9024505-Pyramimonas_sp.AAC.1
MNSPPVRMHSPPILTNCPPPLQVTCAELRDALCAQIRVLRAHSSPRGRRFLNTLAKLPAIVSILNNRDSVGSSVGGFR